jgi:hypothetical protein
VDQSKGLQHRAKRLWHIYIATVDRTLTALFLFSVLVLIAHDILFAGWPELFRWGRELWDLFYQLCLAFAASYIFYFVVVHIKRQRDREALRSILYRETLMVAGDAEGISNDVKKAYGQDSIGDFPPNLEETKRMCRAIDPYSQVPLFAGNWYRMLGQYWERTSGTVGRIHTMMPFLEPEYVQVLDDLWDCFYIQTLPNRLRMHAATPRERDNKTLEYMAKELHEYVCKAKHLQEYAYKNLTLSGEFEPLWR